MNTTICPLAGPRGNGGNQERSSMSNQQGAFSTLPPENRIDINFISGNEGGQYLHGYVPKRDGEPIATSGVTIATGVDLGVRNTYDLARLGLDDDTIKELTPYLGLKGDKAASFLQAHPLTITAEQADALDSGAINSIVDQLQRLYDTDSSVDFWTLPANTQTAVADLAYQYGPNLASSTPIFWSEIIVQDWQMAADELNDFHDPYGPRRMAEGALMQDDIDQHLLCPAPSPELFS